MKIDSGGHPVPLHPFLYRDRIREALHEDLGRTGDITSSAIVDSGKRAKASIIAGSDCRVAGLDVAAEVFRCLDPSLAIRIVTPDGLDAAAGTQLMHLSGCARHILAAERTALNFLGRLCGIATATARVVSSLGDSSCSVVCTRKTTPGLRALEKYAVRVGGGRNHRFGLDDGVLIKDNHLALVDDLDSAIERARRRLGHMVKIEVEVDSLDQLRRILALPVDAVLLDNMNPATLREAVLITAGRLLTEASGGIRPETAPEVAATGVDLISLGWITHSAPCVDVGLEVRPL